jgi:hypothetical protein
MTKLFLSALVVLAAALPASAESWRTTVIGVGSDAMPAEALYNRGLENAIFETRVCLITGRFSTGSNCYAVYTNGRAEYVNAVNRPLVKEFLSKLILRAQQ